VVNKIYRLGARPDWAICQIFDLFDNLGATDEPRLPDRLRQPPNGIAGMDHDNMDAHC